MLLLARYYRRMFQRKRILILTTSPQLVSQLQAELKGFLNDDIDTVIDCQSVNRLRGNHRRLGRSLGRSERLQVRVRRALWGLLIGQSQPSSPADCHRDSVLDQAHHPLHCKRVGQISRPGENEVRHLEHQPRPQLDHLQDLREPEGDGKAPPR